MNHGRFDPLQGWEGFIDLLLCCLLPCQVLRDGRGTSSGALFLALFSTPLAENVDKEIFPNISIFLTERFDPVQWGPCGNCHYISLASACW